MRAHEVIPIDSVRTELLRLARLDREWVEHENCEAPPGTPADMLQFQHYRARCRHKTWLAQFIRSGQDFFAMHAESIWLVDGPKCFKPTPDQCAALENVEVRLTLDDYQQPYPAILIELPASYAPFYGVIVYRKADMLNCVLRSPRGEHDIVTTVGVSNRGEPIEKSLLRFDPDCCDDSKAAARALRVAVNSCLALANWPIVSALMYPHEAESDKFLSRHAKNEDSQRRAAERLSLAVTRLSFEQDIAFHHVEGGHDPSTPTGRQVTTHWRRGHWAMLACGAGRTERRLTFRKATLVRADLFTGDAANTTVSYKGKSNAR
jgi:hypothetical protein